MLLNEREMPEDCKHLIRDIQVYQEENARLHEQQMILEREYNSLEQKISEFEAEAEINQSSFQNDLKTQRKLEALFYNAPVALVLVDMHGEIRFINHNALSLLALESTPSSLPNFKTLLQKNSRVVLVRTIQSILWAESDSIHSQVLSLSDGGLISVNCRGFNGYSPLAGLLLLSITLIDLQKASPFSLGLFSVMFSQSREGIMVTDKEGTIINVNPAFCEITGYDAEEVIGQNPRILNSGYHSPEFYKEMWSQIFNTGYWSGEIWNRRKKGEIYPEWLHIYRVFDDQMLQTFYVANFSDLTDRKKHQQQLDRLAFYDALTGLPNRTMLNNFISEKLNFTENKSNIAVFFLDLDKFKDVNDHYGHPEGDRILREVSQRILSRIREVDMACRLGGDEFVVVLTHIQNNEDAIVVAEDLIESLSKPFFTEQNQHRLTASIGIAFSTVHGSTASDLLRRADAAMYKAKSAGRNTHAIFQMDDEALIVESSVMISRVWQAIESPLTHIEMHYQPIYQTNNYEQPKHYEALVRLKDEEGLLVYPSIFIELAEQKGLMDKFGMAIFEAVCRDIVEQKLDPTIRVAVNLSQHQFYSHQLVDNLEKLAARFDLSLAHFQFEVTETATMENIHLMRDLLESLKKHQAEILLDDFGTGYASLSILKGLPINILKIDQSFVKDIGESLEVETLIKAIIAMAKALNLKLVAEGVETDTQLNWLAEQNVDFIQGFLLSKPAPLFLK